MNSYSKSFDSGHLTPSQKQGTFILIPKKDKDLTDLKSWRPLSLLNSDYKILAKLLAKRLRVTLTEIINPDQIGYMKDRFIGENTRLIADVIDYCKHTLQPCIILLADFEKAFDTINWNFLQKCLTHFGFGPNFRRWMSVLYTDIESCVTNNGYMSQFFKLFRGIRQGCPISALLFLLPAEIIANIIRMSPHIIGLKVNGKCIKLCQLADDMTLFLTDNSSVRHSLRMFEEFYRYAGLKLNKGKTEAIIIQNDGTLEHNLSLGIKWINRPFKTLGTWFSLDNEEMINLNKNDKISIIKSILNSWSLRRLTLKGKVTVIKSFVLPHIVQLVSAIPFSKNMLKLLDEMLFNFIWNQKKPLLSKITLIQPIEQGGMSMVSISEFINASKIMFLKRFCNGIDANWKILSQNLMGLCTEELLRKRTFKNTTCHIKTPFYKDLLSVWCNLVAIEPSSFAEFLDEPLFHNDLLTIDKKPISDEFTEWISTGMSKVRDLVSEDENFLSKSDLEAKYGIQFDHMKYNQIISTVCSKKRLLNIKQVSTLQRSLPRQCLEKLGNIKSREVYNYYITRLYQIPQSQNKWIEYYPILEKADWKSIYNLTYNLTRDSHLISLQYKILHRIFNCNYKLFLWGIKDSSDCARCRDIDNLEHFFFYCQKVSTFWKEIKLWLSSKLNIKIDFTVLGVLLGFINMGEPLFYLVNFITVVGKYYIKQSRDDLKELSLTHFQYCLKDKLKIEECIASDKGNHLLFQERYGFLLAKL